MRHTHIVLMTLLLIALLGMVGVAEKAPLDVAIVWHQHQPLYWNRLTGEYELPWVRVHAVQEYIDSARIALEYPEVFVTYNLQPSLLWQVEDYATISEEEEARGGLYEHIGAVDNHLRWIWTLMTDPEALLPDDRADLQEQAFWLNGYMLDDDGNDPYYDPRYASLNALRAQRDLTDQELLDAAGLFLLWQITPELHEGLGLLSLRGKSGFVREDIVRLIDAQYSVLQQFVEAYADVAYNGDELITSPFYHPILPLLIQHEWSSDAYGQIDEAQRQHQRLFGTEAVGVWPPEQAVSDETLTLLADAGFRWTTTDEGILAGALGHTPSTSELTRVYRWGDLAVLFRDTDLSNRIGFAYGNKPTNVAVQDFMSTLRRIWEELEEPAGHLLTLAMDGENWMFMAGYPNNGRSFLRALYAALTAADWVRPVTPEMILGSGIAETPLEQIPTGSWAGDLSTWSGEPDEDQAWTELAAARDAVTLAGEPQEAIDAIYAAEGSDWFWWYGTDQDSNTDDLYDWLFKAHLIGAYRAAGVAASEIPAALSLHLVAPTYVSLGEVSVAVDGQVTAEDDWSSAASFIGTGALQTVSIGYREGLLLFRVDADSPEEWIGTDRYLTVYATGQPGDPIAIETRYAARQLGFPISYAAQIPLSKVRDDGSGTVTVYAPTSAGTWRSVSTLRTLSQRRALVDGVIEFSVPFGELGIEAGKNVTLNVVLEDDAALLGMASAQPIQAAIPTLIQGQEVFSLADPVGDDDGPGTYTYPTDRVFDVPGLFDLTRYAVYDAGDRWQFSYDFTNLTNPWNGPQGFSHPLLLLYFDVQQGGSIESHEEGEAAHVAFSESHPWDIFLKVAGWPAYGRHLWTADGQGPFLVEVASDPKRGRVIVTVPKTLVPEIAGWHYILVASQDGYGANHVRSIADVAGPWVGGGNPDSIWAPQLYDILAPGDGFQADQLGSYVAGAAYAVLIPIEVKP